MIRFDGVSKVYCAHYDVSRTYAFKDMLRRQRPAELRRLESFALRDLSFSLERGQTLALLGSPGAGKSTVARLICGLTAPSFGTVEVSGTARLVTASALGRTPYMTLGEYLHLVLSALGASPAEVETALASTLEACQLTGETRMKLFNLPIPDLRRVTLHAHLFLDADIFVFDDPVKLKAPEDRALFTDRIEEIHQTRTIVAAASEPRELPESVDLVAVLEEGHLFHLGHADVATRLFEKLQVLGDDHFVEELFAKREVLLAEVHRELRETSDDEARRERRGTEPFELRAHLAAALAPILESSAPIIAGPYLSESGMEALYWAPLLRAVAREFELPPERWIALSRGGAGVWYEGFCGRYVDAYDLYSEAEFDERSRQRVETDGLKQRACSEFEREIVERAASRLELDDHRPLHPGWMIRLLEAVWGGPGSLDEFLEFIDHPCHREHPEPSFDLDLPDDYLAVRFDAHPYFADSRLARFFIRALLEAIESAGLAIVIVNNGQTLLDSFTDFEELVATDRFPHFRSRATRRNNLELQAEIVRHARAYVGTLGGSSYLAPTYGVPTVGLYESTAGNQARHLRATERWFTRHDIPDLFRQLADTDPAEIVEWLESQFTA